MGMEWGISPVVLEQILGVWDPQGWCGIIPVFLEQIFGIWVQDPRGAQGCFPHSVSQWRHPWSP